MVFLGRMPSHFALNSNRQGTYLRRPAIRLLRLAIFLLTALASAHAATIHVPADQPTIQAGIDAAANGDTVLVAPGTYKENIDFKGKAITVISSDGAAKTIVDGSLGNKPAVFFTHTESRNSILSGFTVQGGGQELYYGQMGGILIQNSSPTLVNDIITNNHCYGVWVEEDSAPLIQNSNLNNTLDNNGDCSFAGGAAIYLDGYNPSSGPTVIIGNTIENNTQSGLEDAGGNGGAGIAVWGGTPIIEDNIIRNNHTFDGIGGAILVYGADETPEASILIAQNLIYGNEAGGGGGALGFDGYLDAGRLYIVNNTIVDNTYKDNEGGSSNDYAVSQIYSGDYGSDGPSAALVNNIIAGNTSEPAIQCGWGLNLPDESQQPIFDHNLLLNSGGPIFTSDCIDVSTKYGNISADPKFVNQSGNDYHLQAGSPAIDAGNTSVLQSLAANGLTLSKDFDGNPRVADATGKGYPIIDIGAYEHTGTQDATPTTIVLTPSAYTLVGGTHLSLTAKLISALGIPTGTVTFFEDGKQIGTGTIDSSGTATMNTPPVVPGTHNLIAQYPGQGGFTSATSVVVIVNAENYSVSLSLASTPNPSFSGQNVTFTTKISTTDSNGLPKPDTITLTDTSTNTTLATLTPDANGNASYSTAALALGDHWIQASYPGDSTHAGASAEVDQQVINGYATATTLTSSRNPSAVGQSVTFTATVTSTNNTPAGTVQFQDGNTTMGTVTLAKDSASYTTSTLTAGQHTITAVYRASGSDLASTASLVQTVNGAPTTTSITTIITNPTPAYTSPTISAVVQPSASSSHTPTGTISFSIGGKAAGTAALGLIGGVATASASVNAGPTGNYPVLATYSGDSTFAPSTSAPVTLVVGQETSSVALASSLNPSVFGSAVTFTATASAGGTGTPLNGTFTFYDGTTQLGQAQSATGTGTFTTSTLAVGTHPITVAYSGNASVEAGASATLQQVVNAYQGDFTLTVTPSSASLYTGAAAKFTVTATPQSGFNLPLALSCSGLPVNATCTFVPATLQNGSYSSTLVVQTSAPAQTASAKSLTGGATALASLFTLLLIPRRLRRNWVRGLWFGVALLAALTSLSACGGNGTLTGGTPTGTYSITITASTTVVEPQLSHTAPVALTVKSLF